MGQPEGCPATRTAARQLAVLRYDRRPSALAVVALFIIVAILASLSVWERRTFIDAYARDPSGSLIRAADSPFLITQQPESVAVAPIIPTNGLALHPQFAASRITAAWGMHGWLAWRVGLHVATALFLALAILYVLRRWAMPPATAFLLSVLPAAIYLLMPGPMAFYLCPSFLAAEAIACTAALLLVDSVLDSRRQDLPVLAMILELVILFIGAWTGPYFWIWAGLIFARRLVTRRWRTVTSYLIGTTWFLVPLIMGAVAGIATTKATPAIQREVIATSPGAPGFWAGSMTESYGVFGLTAFVAGAIALAPGLLFAFRNARRTTFAIGGAWSIATLMAIALAAPVLAEILIRYRSTPWDVDTLIYAPAVALLPFTLAPALLWSLLPHEPRRLSLIIALTATVAAAAVIVHESPRARGLLPQPVSSAPMPRQHAPHEDQLPFDVVDFRIRPVDASWCRAYVILAARNTPRHNWNLRLRGAVPDHAVPLLPEHQQNAATAEWLIPAPAAAFPKPPRALMLWRNLRMQDLDYDLVIDFIRTDASGPQVEVVTVPWLELGPFNPFDQRVTCALANGGFESIAPGGPWVVESKNPALLTHEHEMTFRGPGALRMAPGAYYSVLRQDVQSLASLAGRTITFRAMARASEPDSVYLMLTVADQKYYSRRHPGDGGWHELAVSASVPLRNHATAFSVHLGHGGKPKQPAVFDEARLDVR